MAKSKPLGKGVKSGSLTKGSTGKVGGMIQSPIQMIKKGK